MPAISSRTRPKPVRATIDFGDDAPITVVFDRNRVTPRWLDQARQKAEANDALATSTMLAEVILEWDVTEEDGTAYPPTAENLSVFPISDQSHLLQRVVAESVPSDAEGKSSSVQPSTPSSVSEDPPATYPNGLVTSPSPVPSASQFQT